MSGDGLVIRLLGRPSIELNGKPVKGPRGRKCWGVFAYLLLARQAVSRSHLAELLFSNARDPLAAVRWNLSELRRSLGLRGILSGDPIEPRLPESLQVDVLWLSEVQPGGSVPQSFGGELLEGFAFSGSPAYEAWLIIERRRLAAQLEGLLREQAVIELGRRHTSEASIAAARLVALNPLEEKNHELLVRCLLEDGDRTQAVERVEACEALFRQELGIASCPALRGLLQYVQRVADSPAIHQRSVARAELDAGRAAISAGEIEAGIAHLRRAGSNAHSCGDEELQAQALLNLGSTLVHAMRGHDEGASTLHAAVSAAERAGLAEVAATAFRELGFIEVQAGRRERAEIWLQRAEEAAEESDEALAAIFGVRGMNLTDAGQYRAGLAWLERSAEHARSCRDRRQEAWSTSLIARSYLLSGRSVRAETAVEHTLDLVNSEEWIAFLPWPSCLRAELDLQDGEVQAAHARLEHAFTLAIHLGDPCWEGVAARGLGVVEARRNRSPQAFAWFDDARKRCTRVAAPWEWVHGFILDTTCEFALREGDERAGEWIDRLERLAARADLREFAVRAQLHRHRLGEAGALEAADLLAREVDNPALDIA